MYLDALTAYRRVLFLQGPIGPFFWRLANFLKTRGTEVVKVNLNGGDSFFFPAWPAAARVYEFRESATKWRHFLRGVIGRHQIDAIVLFGDCRFYHRAAIGVARRLGVEVLVFEEGYIRPDYITLGIGGVNGYSRLPRDPKFYRTVRHEAPAASRSLSQRGVYSAVLYAMLYGLAGKLTRWRFPYYRHHRSYFSFEHGLLWVRGWARKYFYRFRERNELKLVRGALSNRFFLVPLQVHQDAQVLFHSPYRSVISFVAEVIGSFAAHAPADTYLVFKHHPLDRGFREYGDLIARLATEHGVGMRVRYVHDVHLPTLLDHARGTVLINSTVGMSSLLHGTPVKALGRAIYDMRGLTHQGTLATFWHRPEPIDRGLYQRFRNFVIGRTQVNGNYYLLDGFRLGREIHPSQPWIAPRPWASDPVPRLVYSNDRPVVVPNRRAESSPVVLEPRPPMPLDAAAPAAQIQSN